MRGERRIALRRSAAAGTVEAPPKTFLNDRPSMIGDTVVYVSTEEDVGKPRQGWNGIYSTNFRTSVTKRLSPPGVTDYSPAVSPSGKSLLRSCCSRCITAIASNPIIFPVNSQFCQFYQFCELSVNCANSLDDVNYVKYLSIVSIIFLPVVLIV